MSEFVAYYRGGGYSGTTGRTSGEFVLAGLAP
jgi:hypothetical protein